MATLRARFDGSVFIPLQPVDLPVGTHVGVIIPDTPPELTEEEKRIWERIQKQVDSSPPMFPTVEEALNYSRKRP